MTKKVRLLNSICQLTIPKPPCIFYTRIRTLDILLARVFRVCTHTLHVPMHLRTMNQYIYIYISSHLVSTCIRCIYVSLSHACVIVPLYSFVSFPKRFKLVLFFFFSFPFRISLFFVFTQWRLPLFDDTVEYACLDVDLMGATTTLLYIFLFFGSYRQSIISFFGTKS